ncbi:MAG: lysophospholipid acyltransferase family protein [Ignavibacteria bacterium]|nr:lysophospholipid acyltransferase family protein [Ignavibacteria bacterium]
MIKAQHSKWARIIYDLYFDNLLKKNFSHFYLANKFPKIADNLPLIVTPNHISWWDGFFVDYYFKNFSKRKIYLMMLEEQLKRLPFFPKVGAFSIEPSKIKSIIETFDYSSKIVLNTKNFLVMYPQGEIEAFEKRPLNIKEGLNHLLKLINSEVAVLPLGFRIQYYNEKYPAIIARAGNTLSSLDVLTDFDIFKNEFYNNLDLLSTASIKKEFVKDLFTKGKN